MGLNCGFELCPQNSIIPGKIYDFQPCSQLQMNGVGCNLWAKDVPVESCTLKKKKKVRRHQIWHLGNNSWCLKSLLQALNVEIVLELHRWVYRLHFCGFQQQISFFFFFLKSLNCNEMAKKATDTFGAHSVWEDNLLWSLSKHNFIIYSSVIEEYPEASITCTPS